MVDLRSLRFRLLRALGRLVTESAAVLTLGKMPPFVSASVLIRDGERILTVLDPIRGEPVLPGGHLRWREMPIAAAAREVREETGYEVGDLRLFGVFAGEQLAGEPGIVRVIFQGEVSGGTLRSSAEGEAAWMNLDEFVSRATRDSAIVRGAGSVR